MRHEWVRQMQKVAGGISQRPRSVQEAVETIEHVQVCLKNFNTIYRFGFRDEVYEEQVFSGGRQSRAPGGLLALIQILRFRKQHS